MNVTHLYVGDSMVDLYPDAIVAVTVQAVPFNDIKARRITVSNRFKAPFTENNDILFGFIRDERSVGSTSKVTGKLIQNGITMLQSVNVKVTAEEEQYDIFLLDELSDLFDRVNNKTLSEIIPIDASGWEASDIDSARLNTEGIVTAIVRWGNSTGIYDVDMFLPHFYYHTIVKEILQDTGLTLSGSILTNTDFTELAIPFPGTKFQYSEQDAALMTTRAGSVNPMADQLLEGLVLELELVLLGYPYLWDLTNNQLVIPDNLSPIFDVQIVLPLIDNIIWGGGDALRGRIYRTRDGVTTQVGSSPIFFFFTTSPQSESNASVSFTNIIALPGDRYEFRLDTNSGAATGQVQQSLVIITGVSTVDRAEVNWNQLWPTDIKCEDILRDFIVRFGIVPKQVSNTLYLKTINEIIADRAGAIDWSQKKVKSPYVISKPSYAQVNNFKYQSSSDSEDANLGMGSIDIDDENLTPSRDYYTSIFQSSPTVSSAGYNVANVSVFDSTSTDIVDFVETPGFRLVTLKARSTEGAITFNVSARTDYKLGYFVDPSLTKDTGFQYFIDNHYTLLEAILQNGKLVTKSFYLTEIDVATFDVHKMIWDGEHFYLVNKIKNFIPGKITSVELLKAS